MSGIVTHHPLVLASGSVRRKALLQQANLEFEIVLSHVQEDKLKRDFDDAPPTKKAEELAKAKALTVSKLCPGAYVIGGDQICSLADEIFDKPGTEEAAKEQLKKLSGQRHQQVSAVCIYKDTECLWSFIDIAELAMRKLSTEEINAYIDHDEPLHCCGSYKFESLGCHLFSKFTGSAYTIQGMPLLPTLGALRELGVYSLSTSQEGQ